MKPTKNQLNSIPFQYAQNVLSGKLHTGQLIKDAVQRFYTWIENAEKDGFTLDHESGMRAVNFFPTFLNHTKGKMQGQPFILAPFQQFTIYNIFGWKDAKGNRRINTVYDKRAKKNGKSAEMAGLGLYCMSFDMEMEAEIYIEAAKEYHEGLKSGKHERRHSYSLTYAKKAVNEAQKNLETAKKLWS